MKKILVSMIFLTSACLFASEPSKLHVFAIPGQNGLGSSVNYVENLLGQNFVEVTQVGTPFDYPDLGQSRCLDYIQKACSENTQASIIHATSQGTATAFNYLAKDQAKQIKGMILEAILASGNSAILHTVTGPLMNMPFVAKLPFSYYWLPYLAKTQFPSYCPSGKQAIKSIEGISTHIPIIIVHSKGDMQLPYNDACAMYYSLRKQGNNNVYLISKEGFDHINIMNQEGDSIIIQSILKKHGLLDVDEQVDITKYQPDPEEFKKSYDELIAQERNHERIVTGTKIGAVIGVIYLISRFISCKIS